MGSPCVIAFYGLRFSIFDEEEIEELEERNHKLFKQARESGLKCYWSNFAAPAEEYYCYLGHKVGILSPEDNQEVILEDDQLSLLCAKTRKKLESLGYKEPARLYLHLQPDGG